MSKNLEEYSVQAAYNESFKPTCPPSYSEAVASSLSPDPGANQLSYPGQSGFNPGTGISEAPPVVAVNIQPPVSTLPISVGPKSATVNCPHCHIQVRTKTRSGLQRSAHYACFFLFAFGCCLCSCIPYCLASFKNVYHFCPACKGFIGTHKG